MDTPDVVIEERTKTKIKRPSRYHVVFVNDDFTPMEFVVHVLENIFHKTGDEAVEFMLKVHNEGQALVGPYTREIAEELVHETMDLAKLNEFPLVLKLQRDDDSV